MIFDDFSRKMKKKVLIQNGHQVDQKNLVLKNSNGESMQNLLLFQLEREKSTFTVRIFKPTRIVGISYENRCPDCSGFMGDLHREPSRFHSRAKLFFTLQSDLNDSKRILKPRYVDIRCISNHKNPIGVDQLGGAETVGFSFTPNLIHAHYESRT